MAPPAAGALARGRVDGRAVGLASLYALGHAGVVVVLGLAALTFGAVLPDWVDPVMERLVGVTLVGLGLWVAYALARSWRGGAEFRLRSRWMLVFHGLERGWAWAQTRRHGHRHAGAFHVHPVARTDRYGPGRPSGRASSTASGRRRGRRCS